jgi:hypothetical protein
MEVIGDSYAGYGDEANAGILQSFDQQIGNQLMDRFRDFFRPLIHNGNIL